VGFKAKAKNFRPYIPEVYVTLDSPEYTWKQCISQPKLEGISADLALTAGHSIVYCISFVPEVWQNIKEAQL